MFMDRFYIASVSGAGAVGFLIGLVVRGWF